MKSRVGQSRILLMRLFSSASEHSTRKAVTSVFVPSGFSGTLIIERGNKKTQSSRAPQ